MTAYNGETVEGILQSKKHIPFDIWVLYTSWVTMFTNLERLAVMLNGKVSLVALYPVNLNPGSS